ncbi:MAG TPA: DegT/DnrJ/EryC1/StrS family aminotransferase [Polyangiaceae bacterium]|nr:DegT/DnrJ/EryC1/StrS family aminotransferase [Polyangiaceae bacterium]
MQAKQRNIPLAMPLTGEAEADAARRPILSGWLTQGPEVAAFEQEFASYVGAPHAVALANCTVALHLALLAVGVKPGDDVITVSHSYIATANSIRYCGAEPVFVDVDYATSNMDPVRIEPALTKNTKAILCVHQMGMPCDVEAIVEIGRKHGLPVIEDAACASGSAWIKKDGQVEPIGKPHGDIAAFSFHPRKVITTGDGGMLTTKHAEFDKQFRLLRQHGMSVSDRARHGAREVVFEDHSVLGYNYRMTDVQAAVGREQLKRLPGIVDARRRLAARYAEHLRELTDITLPVEPSYARSNWQSYAIALSPALPQKKLMQALLDRGVASRRGIMNAHREEPYRNNLSGKNLPNSEAAQDRKIILPLYAQLTDSDQDYVIASLREAIREVRG